MEPVTTTNTINKELICLDRSFLPPYPFSSYVSYPTSACPAIESLSVARERHHALEEALPEYQDGSKYQLMCIPTVSVASNDERSIFQDPGCQTIVGRSATRVSACQTITGEVLPEARVVRQSLEKCYPSVRLSDNRWRSATRGSGCQTIAGEVPPEAREAHQRVLEALFGGRLKPLFRSKPTVGRRDA